MNQLLGNDLANEQGIWFLYIQKYARVFIGKLIKSSYSTEKPMTGKINVAV